MGCNTCKLFGNHGIRTDNNNSALESLCPDSDRLDEVGVVRHHERHIETTIEGVHEQMRYQRDIGPFSCMIHTVCCGSTPSGHRTSWASRLFR